MTLVIQKTAGSNLVLANGQKVPVDLYRSNVSLLLHGDGTNNGTTFTDNSPSPKAITRTGTVVTSTTQSKFGGSSLYFPGSSYLSISDIPAIGTSDFTIELWFYPTLLNSASGIIDFRPNGTGTSASPLIYTSSNTLIYYVSGGARITAGSALSLNQWYHIAVSRSGTTTKMFLNGTQTGSNYTDSTNYIASTNRPNIGAFGDFPGDSNTFIGYVDDLRISTVARYTANFTPPTAPFPDI